MTWKENIKKITMSPLKVLLRLFLTLAPLPILSVNTGINSADNMRNVPSEKKKTKRLFFKLFFFFFTLLKSTNLLLVTESSTKTGLSKVTCSSAGGGGVKASCDLGEAAFMIHSEIFVKKFPNIRVKNINRSMFYTVVSCLTILFTNVTIRKGCYFPLVSVFIWHIDHYIKVGRNIILSVTLLHFACY